MELVVISDPGIVANEAQIINRLFEAGLSCFHLRKPGWDIGRCIDLLTQIDQAYHQAIACHQHHQLAKVFGMKHVHYTEKDRVNTDKLKLNEQANSGYTLSTSIHQLSQLPLVTAFEYVFYGPVFSSISKPGYRGVVPDDFCLDKNMPRPKVIALGGINESNLDKVNHMNFDGAAVLGAIWSYPQQAVSNFIKIKKATEQLNS